MRKTGFTIAVAALALTACDPAPAAGPPPTTVAALTAPAADVAQLVAAARAGIAAAPSATFTMDAVLGTSGKSATGSLRFDGDTRSLTLTVDGSETRVIGKRSYTHVPVGLPGKPWVGSDPDSPDRPDNPLARAAGGVVPTFVRLPDLDHALTGLARAGRIVSAEQTRLRDLPVNHYRLEIDAAKIPDLFPEFTEPPTNGKPAKPITAKLPAELWLDAAQRPARFTVDLASGFPQPGTLATFKGTTDYRDWGDPVEIETPPADQVVDIWELIKKMGT
ncbi:hypothetical protein [Amycolatopsis sp. NPDC051128]|uniref:hypothetical protein n=1 Tax=Amycolatopsis sp. NPDC051128 TaxID=3155412 RepID=UPI003422338E